MATRERYYTALGVKTTDQKPSLENALQGDLLDKQRLLNLCVWIKIPHVYRVLVWKLVLGVLPLYKPSWTSSTKDRQEQFLMLKDAAILLWNGTNNDQELTAELMVQMALIELDNQAIFTIEEARVLPVHLIHLASAFLNIYDDVEEEDAFWTFACLIERLNVPLTDYVPNTGQIRPLLSQHSPDVLEKLESFKISPESVIIPWISSYFSNIFSFQVLEIIWDILIGGEEDILQYSALGLFLGCKRKLLACKTEQECLQLLKTIERNVDLYWVAQTSIELWERPVLDQMTEDTKVALGLK